MRLKDGFSVVAPIKVTKPYNKKASGYAGIWGREKKGRTYMHKYTKENHKRETNKNTEVTREPEKERRES